MIFYVKKLLYLKDYFLIICTMNQLKIWALLLVSFFTFWAVHAATVDNIQAIDNNTVEMTANPGIVFSDIEVKGEVKLLKDIPVSFSARDPENFKKILLNLSSDLTANTSYSLISILGADGNIDFEIWDFLTGEVNNENLTPWTEWIEKVNVVDSRTIELYFTTDVTDEVFEFKILSDIDTSGLSSMWDNKVQVEISKNLEKSTDYILMILSLEDAVGNKVQFEDDLYDFTTPADLKEEVVEEEVVVAQTEEAPEVIDEWNMEEVALNSAETPETGTATWILILIAILANLWFFLAKRRK